MTNGRLTVISCFKLGNLLHFQMHSMNIMALRFQVTNQEIQADCLRITAWIFRLITFQNQTQQNDGKPNGYLEFTIFTTEKMLLQSPSGKTKLRATMKH